MCQIPNYLITLDFLQNRIVKIKLSDEEKQFASSCDDLEEMIDALSEKYHFSLTDSQWMTLSDYKEESFGFTKS